jgi:hypothetical protein
MPHNHLDMFHMFLQHQGRKYDPHKQGHIVTSVSMAQQLYLQRQHLLVLLKNTLH